MQRSSVDLPEPEGPMMHTTSPFGTDRSMPRSTSSGPKDFHTCSSRTIGAASSPVAAAATLVLLMQRPSVGWPIP